MRFTQENRLLTVTTPLGKDVFVLTELKGEEGISQPFSFDLTLVSEDTAIAPHTMIGGGVTVSLRLAGDETRHINGIVSAFRQERIGVPGGDDSFIHAATYTARLVPWTWLLTQSMNSRIFQNKDVVQIVEQVFRDKGLEDFEFRLKGGYTKREYCVQYRESDFDFVSRLLEEEGIFYFFEHTYTRHVLVLADASDVHRDCPNQSVVRCLLAGGSEAVQSEDVITHLGWGEEMVVGAYATSDYNFLTPAADLKVHMPSRFKGSPVVREVYDYPGRFASRAQGERYAELRMQAEEARIATLRGRSNCRTLASGYRFTLEEYHRDDMNGRPYVLLSVAHEVREPVEITPGLAEASYTNTFTCIPHDVTFRPPLKTGKPVISGVQTAVVTGPEGEEIYTDEHGRVKVQFHWDREGQRNEDTTCFIRVGQIWAGQGWGAVWIPRIGHEVVVAFVEGDPDRPLIIGSVYNAANTVPYALPEHKTRSTIKSNSTPGGDGFNEIRFEDKKGQEEVFIHAQKDHTIVVKHNRSATVGADDSVSVSGNRSLTVQGAETIVVKRSCERTIVQGETLTIAQGRTVKIDGGEKRTITGGLTLTVDGGETVTVQGAKKTDVSGEHAENCGDKRLVRTGADFDLGAAGKVIVTSGGDVTVRASGKITLSCGGSEVCLDPLGKVTVKASSQLTLTAAGSSVDLGPQGVSISTGGMITLTGTMIKNNC